MSDTYKTPDISFLEIDTEAIVNDMLADYAAASGRTLGAADPVRMVILWAADMIAGQRFVIDKVAKMNSPRYAEGKYLDLLCELFDRAGRRMASSAKTTLRFTISEIRPSAVIVPSGTRVRGESGGASAVFATTEEIIIVPGELTGDAPAECLETGVIGNGFAAGTITECVDVFNYYFQCENITVSEGGADTETDAEFYEQMRKSLEGYSTAGPRGAYEYHAKSANPGIADVKAVSETETVTISVPVYCRNTGGSEERCAFIGGEQILLDDTITVSSETGEGGIRERDYAITYDGALLRVILLPGGVFDGAETVTVTFTRERAGRVRVSVLMKDGRIPGSEVLEEVAAVLNTDNIRPLTDVVTVSAPDVVLYDIDLTYYIPYGGHSALAAERAVEEAVQRYIAWQSDVMGRDINPSKLNEMVMQTGFVKRVVIRAPEYKVIGSSAAALLGTSSVVNGGREYE